MNFLISDMKVLFICNQNQNRSKTAEEIFKNKFEVRSAGLYNERPVKKSQLEWAEVIVVMEDDQRTEIGRRFPEVYLKKQIISLNIPDVYSYKQPELINILRSRMPKILN